jgi:1,2-diacylglycerol 3-alpha-glucosyltransferase
MHLVVLFYNLGGYHVARLQALQTVCRLRGWTLTAIQEVDSSHEHPWGDISKRISFCLETLVLAEEVHSLTDENLISKLATNRLPAYLDRLQPDVLIIPGWGFPAPRTAIKWARQHRTPAVLMSESKWNDEYRYFWKEKLKYFLYIRQFQSALVGGQLHKDYLVKLGMPDQAIFLGYDVVDNQYFSEQARQARLNSQQVRQKLPQIPERPYFIAVTRLIPRKNVISLIMAFAKYRDQVPPLRGWDLVICGSGEELDNISHCIRTHNLEECIHLPGFQTYQVLPYWFGLASAFIHPALREQWGLVVNEAMAAGLPVLVSNRCGCFQDVVIEGINGFGFDPTNQPQLTDLMLKMSSDDVDLKAMGEASLQHIQNYSPEHFAQGLKGAIDYAISR